MLMEIKAKNCLFLAIYIIEKSIKILYYNKYIPTFTNSNVVWANKCASKLTSGRKNRETTAETFKEFLILTIDQMDWKFQF